MGLTNGLSRARSTAATSSIARSTVVAGKGKLVITGLLEKGMEERAQAADELHPLARSGVLGLEPDFYQKIDVHVHFPDFVRRTEPSAGVTMATSIASALMRVPVQERASR